MNIANIKIILLSLLLCIVGRSDTTVCFSVDEVTSTSPKNYESFKEEKEDKGDEYMNLEDKILKSREDLLKQGINEEDKGKKMKFKKVELDHMPSSLVSITKMQISKEGYHYTEIDSKKYIAIFAGRKPSSGYGIKVISVKENEDKIVVTVKNTVPEEDKSYLTVLTYPNTVVEFKSNIKKVVVEDVYGNEYKPLNAVESCLE